MAKKKTILPKFFFQTVAPVNSSSEPRFQNSGTSLSSITSNIQSQQFPEPSQVPFFHTEIFPNSSHLTEWQGCHGKLGKKKQAGQCTSNEVLPEPSATAADHQSSSSSCNIQSTNRRPRPPSFRGRRGRRNHHSKRNYYRRDFNRFKYAASVDIRPELTVLACPSAEQALVQGPARLPP